MSSGRLDRGRSGLPAPDAAGPPPPLGGIGAVLAAYGGGTAVAVVLVSLVVAAGARTDDVFATAASFIGLWAGFVGVPVLLSRVRGTGRLSADVGLRFGGPADVGLGLAGGLLSYGAVGLYSLVISSLGDHADLGHEAQRLFGPSHHGLSAAFYVGAAAAAVGAPIAEEIFFRGLSQPVLQGYLGGVGGLALTSVAFGFAHLGSNPIEAIFPLAFFGAVVGTLAWRTGRLGPGIVAHMTFNGITVVAIALSRSR